MLCAWKLCLPTNGSRRSAGIRIAVRTTGQPVRCRVGVDPWYSLEMAGQTSSRRAFRVVSGHRGKDWDRVSRGSSARLGAGGRDMPLHRHCHNEGVAIPGGPNRERSFFSGCAHLGQLVRLKSQRPNSCLHIRGIRGDDEFLIASSEFRRKRNARFPRDSTIRRRPFALPQRDTTLSR